MRFTTARIPYLQSRLLGCVLAIFLQIPVMACAEELIALTQDEQKNLGIVTAPALPIKQYPIVTAPATVVIPPANERVVSSTQPGIVTQVLVANGDQVSKDQVLLLMTSPELVNLQAKFLNADNALKQVNISLERNKKLFREGVIAEKRVLESELQFNSAQFQVNEARQLLELAGMGAKEINVLAQTQKMHQVLTVRAPSPGVILERMITAGSHVDSMTPLYRIGNLQELWLEISVPQELHQRIKSGDSVVLQNSDSTAQIAVLGQNVNPDNQTLSIRAKLQSNTPKLWPGQKLSVQILEKLSSKAYKVPAVALAQHQGTAYVFARRKEGFALLPVQVIANEANETIISGELGESEIIAVKGSVTLKAKWLGLGEE